MLEQRQVVDINDYDGPVDGNNDNPVARVSSIMVAEVHEGSRYYEWEVVENPTGEEEGYGYLTDEQARVLNDFCIAQGAEVGTTVLINHDY